MARTLTIHDGVIRPSMLRELESFRDPGQQISTYYLDLNQRRWGTTAAVRIAVKNKLAEERRRLDEMDLSHAMRQTLRTDLTQVEELALEQIGQRNTAALACFIASRARYGFVVRIPWPVRSRAFFEEQFVLWPLNQVLDQGDRYAICLTDKDDARLFLFHMERIEEVAQISDEIPGRVRVPDPMGEGLKYFHKHVLYYRKHFAKVAERALRLVQRESVDHVIIGGLYETLPEFESYLHRYVSDRIVARWKIEVQRPPTEIFERTQHEEQQVHERHASDTWRTIQDQRPTRGALGPEEVFAAIWQRRAATVLMEPERTLAGWRCTACGRLQLAGDACLECGGKTAEVPDLYEEAAHDVVEQSAHVLYWKDPALKKANSVAALQRF
jgi:hypothetical protein